MADARQFANALDTAQSDHLSLLTQSSLVACRVYIYAIAEVFV